MHCSLLMGDISVAIFLWGEFFFATCFRQIIFFCAKNNFSSHLATMAIGSANPENNFPLANDSGSERQYTFTLSQSKSGLFYLGQNKNKRLVSGNVSIFFRVGRELFFFWGGGGGANFLYRKKHEKCSKYPKNRRKILNVPKKI